MTEKNKTVQPGELDGTGEGEQSISQPHCIKSHQARQPCTPGVRPLDDPHRQALRRRLAALRYFGGRPGDER